MTRTSFSFDGEDYLDDRMYIFSLGECIFPRPRDGIAHVAICVGGVPPGRLREATGERQLWCVATHQNTARRPIVNVTFFTTRRLAEFWLEQQRPRVPLVSLGAKAVDPTPSAQEWAELGAEQGWDEYDPDKMFSREGRHEELVMMRADAVRIYREE